MAVISVIGAGFSGLSAACYLAAAGHEVHVFEKNSKPGGRARQFTTTEGFVFDMGPSWYWMPDVFERFFEDFGYKVSDFYQLEKLQPAYDIVFDKDTIESIPADFEDICKWFEKKEKGSAVQLKKYMEEAGEKYRLSMESLVYKPGVSIFDYTTPETIRGLLKLKLFSGFSKHLRSYFWNNKILALLEFPVLFLGATPKNTPALFSLMNYACMQLGTWYPMGGFGKVVDSFAGVADSLNVQFHYQSEVSHINIENDEVVSINVNEKLFNCDGVIASADYEHVESKLLDEQYRNYSSAYWESRVFAPSCLVFYLGLSRRLKNINHHTLYFDESLEEHSEEIYNKKVWPSKPLFYVCCPSRTDDSVAPQGCENLFLLMPLAPGIEDTDELREKYLNVMLNRMKQTLKEDFLDVIIYKKSFCINDYTEDYNAYKGNAYGLANTLSQTAIFRPRVKNSKVSNLFYTGQLTNPGPGVPPAIISGKIAAKLLNKTLKNRQYETVF